MRVFLSLPVIVAMLSCCAPTDEQEPAQTETPEQVAEAPPSIDSAPAAKAPTSTSTDLSASESTMPQAVRGQWRENDLGRVPTHEDCNQTSQSNRNFGKVLTINSGGYSAFEDGGRIIEVHKRTGNMIDATFDTTYADTRTSARKDYALQSNGALAVNNDDGDGRLDVTEYLRCP